MALFPHRAFPDAIETYTRLIAADPESPKAPLYLYALGVAHTLAGDREAARRDFAEALHREPKLAIPPSVDSPSSLLLNDNAILQRWLHKRSRSKSGPNDAAPPRPKLVVVAVSGGGIAPPGGRSAA